MHHHRMVYTPSNQDLGTGRHAENCGNKRYESAYAPASLFSSSIL